MKPIATPAFRPTAGCIWSSFRSSGKRHLILTGARGSGKSTLIGSLFPSPMPGLISRALPGEAVFLQETLSGKCARIGIFDPDLPGTENRMAPCAEGFFTLGIPALRRCAQQEGEWTVIDEIGYLETCCGEYCRAIESLMEKKRLVAAVRKQELPFLGGLISREDVFCVDLDRPYGNCACVIMASGQGKRFGGNKLTADLGGRPVIGHVLDATDEIFERRIVVTRHEAVAGLCKDRGIDHILHDLPHRSDTVRLGLEAIGPAERCMFVQGDQPLLRQESVAAMAAASLSDPQAIWRAGYGGQAGSPVLFAQWAFEELMALPEGKGGGVLIKTYPGRVRIFETERPQELMDIDTPEDLAQMQRILCAK